MGNCGSCSGNCGSCSGCARELVLSKAEIGFLQELGQIPFLPVARKASDMIPVFLEEGAPENASVILQVLEKKGLVDIDYSKVLAGADMSAYTGYPVHGSIALTGRGQTVVELLQNQGFTD